MIKIVRIDVRKSQTEAQMVALAQQTKGFDATVENATLAIWNWSPDAGKIEPDVVASDTDSEVWLVISRSR